ncbi:hypothetical protein [Haloarcula pelagica]|uniref:hypothetical protein n=1 Tax=Halomicroarcula sp. GCM10025709 TaxID=3252669 RepID=UPI0036D35FF4
MTTATVVSDQAAPADGQPLRIQSPNHQSPLTTTEADVTTDESDSEDITATDLLLRFQNRTDRFDTFVMTVETNSTMDGNQTYSAERTVWVDTDTYFPEKVHTAVHSENYSFEATQDYRNVSLNESLSDDRFDIDVRWASLWSVSPTRAWVNRRWLSSHSPVSR